MEKLYYFLFFQELNLHMCTSCEKDPQCTLKKEYSKKKWLQRAMFIHISDWNVFKLHALLLPNTSFSQYKRSLEESVREKVCSVHRQSQKSLQNFTH